MWEYVGAFLPNANQQNQIGHHLGNAQSNALAAQYNNPQASGLLAVYLNHRPGGVVVIEPPSKECEGCGAPAVRYTHHCAYCKRPR